MSVEHHVRDEIELGLQGRQISFARVRTGSLHEVQRRGDIGNIRNHRATKSSEGVSRYAVVRQVARLWHEGSGESVVRDHLIVGGIGINDKARPYIGQIENGRIHKSGVKSSGDADRAAAGGGFEGHDARRHGMSAWDFSYIV